MGFFLPALFVGGLGVTQHLASRELDDIVRQAEQPLFGFWWGFSLGAFTGLWIGCNFGPLVLKIKKLVSSVGGWMFLSAPPLFSGGGGRAPAAAAAGTTDTASAGIPSTAHSFMHANGYAPYIHCEHMPQLHPQHPQRATPHDMSHTGTRVVGSGSRTTGAGTGGGGGNSNGHVMPPCYPPSGSTHFRLQNDELEKHAFWPHLHQVPHGAGAAGNSSFVSPGHNVDLDHAYSAGQPAKQSSSGLWW